MRKLLLGLGLIGGLTACVNGGPQMYEVNGIEYQFETVTDPVLLEQYYREGLALFEADRSNLRLIKEVNCRGIQTQIYVPRRVNLSDVTRNTGDEYEIWTINEGVPETDYIGYALTPRDWQIFDPDGAYIWYPQIPWPDVETNRFPSRIQRISWEGWPRAIGPIGRFGSLSDMLMLYTDGAQLRPGMYTFEISFPERRYIDGQSCGLGRIEFSVELYGTNHLPIAE